MTTNEPRDEKPDLSLVPLEDIRGEIYKRTEACLIITTRSEDAGDPIVEVNFHGGSVTAIGLAEVAKERLIRKVWGDYEGHSS